MEILQVRVQFDQQSQWYKFEGCHFGWLMVGLWSQILENIMTFDTSGCGSKTRLESFDKQNRDVMGVK